MLNNYYQLFPLSHSHYMGIQQQRACLCGSLQSTCCLLTSWELAKVEESWENSLMKMGQDRKREGIREEGQNLNNCNKKGEGEHFAAGNFYTLFLEVPELCKFCAHRKTWLFHHKKSSTFCMLHLFKKVNHINNKCCFPFFFSDRSVYFYGYISLYIHNLYCLSEPL